MRIVLEWMEVQDSDDPMIGSDDSDWLQENCPKRSFSIARRHRLEQKTQKIHHIGDRWEFPSEGEAGREDLAELEQICCWYFLEYLGHFFVPRDPRVRVDKRPRVRRCSVCGELFIAERANNLICSSSCRTKASIKGKKKGGRKKVSK